MANYLGEQDPRKQGLKHVWYQLIVWPDALGEQDPRKQGLKLPISCLSPWRSFTRRARSKKTRIETSLNDTYPLPSASSESKIQENKDWNARACSPTPWFFSHSESKIQENKDWNPWPSLWFYRCLRRRLGEQDPRKQGLKHAEHPNTVQRRNSSESKIQENKDWNWYSLVPSILSEDLGEQDPRKQGLKPFQLGQSQWCHTLGEQDPRKQGLKPKWPALRASHQHPRRARSKKTRIETWSLVPVDQMAVHSESKIQENKDWNLQGRKVAWPLSPRRARSKKTRIETGADFQIEFDKDLGEQDPRKQGLKRHRTTAFYTDLELGEQDPRKQGLKRRASPCASAFSALGEQDPRKQGLKRRGRNAVRSQATYSESKIQENKDWNAGPRLVPLLSLLSESKIQENKDWNVVGGMPYDPKLHTRRARSKKTRIETLQAG